MDEDFDEDCGVCGGTGLLIETVNADLLVQCARCNGDGKKTHGAYYLGEACTVCNGKGYISIQGRSSPEIWDLLHPRVCKAARNLFEAKNYTEALTRCIKELNIELKQYYRTISGEELDGHVLVGKMLSIEKPVLKIAELETESGRNMQKGLMQILQGLFVGIRNPISHDRTIGFKYCIHALFMLSFVHYQLDYSDLRYREE